MSTQNQESPINSPTLLGSSGPGGSTTNAQPACAACKYQRRRCTPDCPLAAYFPATHPKDFINTRRLFGVKNIIKTARSVKPPDRDKAVKSMIYEANVRAADPVGGCMRLINDLKKQIATSDSELVYYQSLVQHFRAMSNNMEIIGNPNVVENVNVKVNDLNMGGVVVQNGTMNLGGNDEDFGLKRKGFYNGASSSFSGLNMIDNGVCSSGLQFSDILPNVDVKPAFKIESTKDYQLSDNVATLKEDVDAIPPPQQLTKQGENCLIDKS